MDFIKNNYLKILYISGVIIIVILYFITFKDYEFNKFEEPIEGYSMDYKEQLIIDGMEYDIILDDNETANALKELFPLKIDMKDLNSNEKYYYFKETLPVSPKSINKVNAGDIMIYGDNCLVIFYKSFETKEKYTKVGTIEDIESLSNNIGKGTTKVELLLKEIYTE